MAVHALEAPLVKESLEFFDCVMYIPFSIGFLEFLRKGAYYNPPPPRGFRRVLKWGGGTKILGKI